MKSKILVISGCIALGLCFSLNVRNTLNDYDIPNISLVSDVWAQSGSGTGTGNGLQNSCITEITDYIPTFSNCFFCQDTSFNCVPGACTHVNALSGATYTLKCVKVVDYNPTSFCWDGKESVSYVNNDCCEPGGTYYILRAYMYQCKNF